MDLSSRPRIVVNKQMEGNYSTPGFRMWCGICTGCWKEWKYWHFGATFGYGLEHLRICTALKRLEDSFYDYSQDKSGH